MKEIWKYLVPAFLGIIIGALAYHLLFRPADINIDQPPETTSLQPQPFKPDTVRIVEYVKVPVKPSQKLPPPGKPPAAEPDIVTAVDVEDSGDDVVETILRPYHESELSLFYGADMIPRKKFQLQPNEQWLAKTTTWAYSVSPTDSIKQDLVVRWNLYYQTYVEPVMQETIREHKLKNKFDGVIAGVAMTAGLVSQEWWGAAAGLGFGYLIIFDVIELPF